MIIYVMIYLISGVPGSGKSTIARELIGKFTKSFLIETDVLRGFVKSGYSSPTEWTKETSEQFRLAAQNTCDLAKNADKFGFDVVIDDAVSLEQEEIYVKELPNSRRIWLNPSLDIILDRNSKRGKLVDEQLIRNVYERLVNRKNMVDRWISIDSTHLTIQETLEKIL